MERPKNLDDTSVTWLNWPKFERLTEARSCEESNNVMAQRQRSGIGSRRRKEQDVPYLSLAAQLLVPVRSSMEDLESKPHTLRFQPT